MRFSLKRIILVCTSCMLLLFAKTTKASHIMGSDITYRCFDNTKYEITLKVYRDCLGSTLASTQNIEVYCGKSGLKLISVTLSRVKIKDITGVGESCPASYKSYCAGGANKYGIEEHTYTAIANFYPYVSCNSLTLSWAINARNTAITTGAANKVFYTEATIYTDINNCNSSPQFTTPATALVCLGSDFVFNNGAIDTIDNDLLTYRLVDPLQSRNNAIPYYSPYSSQKPLNFLNFPTINAPLPGGFHLDSTTGNLNFRPMLANQVTVLVLEVTEWREIAGVLRIVGKTKRDIQISVINCNSNTPPTIVAENDTICAGNNVSIAIGVNDLNGADSVFLDWNKAIPGASFTRLKGNISTRDSAIFSWTPKIGEGRADPYYFAVTAKDNACPLQGQAVKAISIVVIPQPKTAFTINDSQQCLKNHSFDFINTTQNKNLFGAVWKLPQGELKDSIDVKNITFTDTGNYNIGLVLSSSKGCKDSLYKTVRVKPMPNPDFIGLQPHYCLDSIPLSRILTPIDTGGTFAGKNMQLDNYIPQTLGADTVHYTVSVDGCEADTFMYTEIHPYPVAAFTIDNDSQCFKNNVFNFTNTSSLSVGTISSRWIFSDGRIPLDSTDVHQINFANAGTYTTRLVATSDYGCENTTEAGIVVFAEPNPIFTGLQATYCQNAVTSQLLPMQTGGVFSGANISGTVDYQPQKTGDDSVTYTITVNGCTGTSTQYTTVHPTPVLNIGKDVNCFQEPFTIDVTFPNSTYLWHDGSTQPTFFVHEPGDYGVTLYNICDTLSKAIKVKDCFYIAYPKSFSPNGDGLNEVFMPYIENATSIVFKIYNRWGEEVFVTDKLGQGWDGKYKGVPVQDGLYIWYVQVEYYNENDVLKREIEKGTLTLLR